MSIKLCIFVFSIACYMVLNCSSYNESFIYTKFHEEGEKCVFDYISDSIKRIFYTLIIGGLISLILGIVFNIENAIEEANEKITDSELLYYIF